MQTQKLLNRVRGFTDAMNRFPLTVIFLLAATIVNAFDINSSNGDYSRYLMTLLIGAFLGIVVQVIYERFLVKGLYRLILLGGATFVTFLYYLIIREASKLSAEIEIRTLVALFALMIAFIWVPVIKSKISFNESFMITFKAFFIALFFSVVIYAGISIIIVTVNQLLFTISYHAYSHGANIIFLLFAPLYFLSLIPVYPGDQNKSMDLKNRELHEEQIDKMSFCPKYLEILISFIIIPLTAVFTIILTLYIIRNISGRFWTDSLLEPMIVSYSIAVIVIYILASRLNNRFATVFRTVFPKVLVPIVLFQTISSILRIGDMGITHSRYYVILYGIFATVAGIVLSIVPVRKNGIIAAMLIAFSIVSITPPVDAFTISRNSQIQLLEEVLDKNNMLRDNEITPNADISDVDKRKIIDTVNYISRMDYSKKVSWLPKDYDNYIDFFDTFGFHEYDAVGDIPQYVSVSLSQDIPIDIKGYDFLLISEIYMSGQEIENNVIGDIVVGNEKYSVVKNISKDQTNIAIIDKSKKELIQMPIKELFQRFENYSSEKGLISIEEATFRRENDRVAIAVVVQSLNMDKSIVNSYSGANIYILVKIK